MNGVRLWTGFKGKGLQLRVWNTCGPAQRTPVRFNDGPTTLTFPKQQLRNATSYNLLLGGSWAVINGL